MSFTDNMIIYKDKQSGGTFVGFIVGLIVGLAIAVVVAMVITKTPVPFINRPAKDKTSATLPSQMSDPNKALYGNKDAAKEAAKEFSKDDATAAQQPAQAVTPPSTTQPAANKAPIVDKSTADKPRTDNPDDKWIYYLQAGAFRDQAEAEGAKAKLALQGFEAQISERSSENGALYRVRVGPFNGIDAMNKVRSKMSDNGVDVAVVRVPK